MNFGKRGLNKSMRCRNCGGAGHYQSSCAEPFREKAEFCHICKAVGHDTLICKLRGISCVLCGNFGHERSHCEIDQQFAIDKDTSSFFDAKFYQRVSGCKDGKFYQNRLVSVQDALFCERADADRMIMLSEQKLVEFTSARRLPVHGEVSVNEFLRQTYRQLVEFHEAEELSTRANLDEIVPQFHNPL